MDWQRIVVPIVGAVIMLSGVLYAFHLRRRGGAAVRTPRWYLAVLLGSGGAALLAVSVLVPLLHHPGG